MRRIARANHRRPGLQLLQAEIDYNIGENSSS